MGEETKPSATDDRPEDEAVNDADEPVAQVDEDEAPADEAPDTGDQAADEAAASSPDEPAEWVAAEPVADTLEEPTAVRAAEEQGTPADVGPGLTIGKRHMRAGVAAVLAAAAVGAGGYAIGEALSNDSPFDASPTAFVQGPAAVDGGQPAPSGAFAADIRGYQGGQNGDCPDLG